MNRHRWARIVLVPAIAGLVCSGCSSGTVVPTLAPSPTRSPTPTSVPTSTRTATPLPTKTNLPEVTYIVKAGDTLSEIAKQYGTSVEAIAAANGILYVSLIRVGQKLSLRPPGAATATRWRELMGTATQSAGVAADATRTP